VRCKRADDHTMMFLVLRRARLRILLLAVAVTVSACAGAQGVVPETAELPVPTVPGDVTSGTQPTPTSAYGGTVVVGFADVGAPRSLNPLLESPDATVLGLLAPAVFAHGFDVDPASGAYLPDAFTAVPSLEDGSIVDNGDGTLDAEVEIVDGARWADGTPITANDLEFTYDVITDPSLPIRSELTELYGSIVAGSLRPDGRTLKFRMRAGTDPAAFFSIILPRHAIEGSDFVADWNDRMWVSGGPFELSDWQPGQFVELSRNVNYWKVTQAEAAPLPFLDRIVVRFFEPGEAIDPRLVEGFSRGEIDVMAFEHAERRASVLETPIAAGVIVEQAPSGEWEHLNFQFGPANRNTESSNASATYRGLIARAIDREALAADRGTTVLHSILGNFVPGLGDDPFSQYSFDPDAVRQALGSDQPSVLVTIPSDDPSTVALGGDIVTMLRDVGFDAELQLEDAALFFGMTLDNGSWDVSAWRYGAGFGLGAAARFLRFYDPDGLPFVGNNYFPWGTVDSRVRNGETTRFGGLIDAMDRTVDPEALSGLLTEAEEILADATVMLPLFLAGETGLAHRPEAVSGVSINRLQGPLWNADIWRIPIE
jgi:peptide/nickel transport system substrate-binding protein